MSCLYVVKWFLHMYFEKMDRLDSYFKHRDTVKPVLRGHSKIDKIKVLKTNCSLVKIESIAACCLAACCNTFDLHLVMICLENKFLSSF